MTIKLTEKCERMGYVCTIIWAMLFVFNMLFYVWTKHPFSLFIAGVMLGGTIIYLTTLPYENRQNKMIDNLLERWSQSIDKYADLLQMINKKIKKK